MSGTTIRIFPPRNFDFSGLAAGQSLTMALAERIGASQYTSADILVRVHSLTISGSAKIEVQLYAEAWTPDDPLKTFAKTLATATIDGQTQVNDLVIASVSSGLGSMLLVGVKGTQSGSMVTVTGVLSADLALKA